MRIHRLEVEAFGPFAGRVSVDLDAVSTAGLFLVRGPTGSGKTSLLDAVCFALYADVPGSRGRQGLRSDHAAPEAAPRVVLEVTVAGRRLRITRSPAWNRPKRRGAGTRSVPATVSLEERHGESWRVVSTRNDEVAEEVHAVLGMGLRQFASVVVLPQGEFAAFLRATPEVRRDLLERLFDIGLFGDVEEWLADARRAGATALDTATAGLRHDLVRLEEALGPALEVGPGGAPDDTAEDTAEERPGEPPVSEVPFEALPQRLTQIAAQLERQLTDALGVLDAAEQAESAATSAQATGRAIDVARRRGEDARRRLVVLEGWSRAHADRLAALDRAERAARVQGHLAAHRRAEADLEDRRAQADAARTAVAGFGVDPATGAAELLRRTSALDSVAQAVAREAAGAREVASALEGAGDRRSALADRLETLAVELPAARSAVGTATEAVEQLAAGGSRADSLADTVAEHERRLALHDEIDAERAALAALDPPLAGARTQLADALGALVDLQQRRLAEMASELAAALEPDAPCPVCGSSAHPDPAVAADPVTAEQLAAGEAAVTTARTRLAGLEQEASALDAAVRTRLEVLDGADRDTVSIALDASRTALREAQEAALELDGARATLQRLQTASDRLAAEHDKGLASLEALDERLAELTDEAQAATRRLEGAVEEHAQCPCGGSDPRQHVRVRDALTALVRGEEELGASQARLARATDDLEAAVAEAGFDSPDAVAAAVLPLAETDRLRDAVLDHDRELAAARAVLAEDEVLAALEAEPVDLPALEEDAAQARRAVLAATSRHEGLVRASRALERVRPSLETRCRAVGTLSARQDQVRELADTVTGTGGDNTLRMRLTSFVLAARLEKVAQLANERLTVMGGGRYLLEHTDDRAARGARSGLGLRVLDQWTGQARETASLSGGESFMASLALALGLADAVREEAGGLDLGTLFIDEGFGTLDEESLEQVLTVLDGLREGGRAVGVVSHVADLRSRIPHQLVVHKAVAGSDVSVRAGSGAPAA